MSGSFGSTLAFRSVKGGFGVVFLSLVILLSTSGQSFATKYPPIPENYNCITCHLELDDEVITPPVNDWMKSVHREVGIKCADCHGGDPHNEDLAMEEEAGFLGAPDRVDIPDFCAKCHSDAKKMKEYGNLPTNQHALYSKSVHGKKSASGDNKAAVCVDCHGKHNIKRVKAPNSSVHRKNISKTCAKCHSDTRLMRRYNQRSDQFLLYSGSVHGKKVAGGDMEAAVCIDCHNNHDILEVKDPLSTVNRKNVINTCGKCHNKKEIFEKRRKPYNQLELYKKSHHYKMLTQGDVLVPTCVECHANHAVLPVRSERVQTICFTCHTGQAEFYKSSPHWEAFQKDGEPICLTCHKNHDIAHPTLNKYTADGDNDCIGCHDEDSDAYKAGLTLKSSLESATKAYRSAVANLERLESDGHGGFETSSLAKKVEKTGERLKELHTLTHRLDIKAVKRDSEKLIKTAQTVDNQVDEFWEEIRTRKFGLAFAWVIFLGLGGSLWKWSRSVEKDRE